MAYFQPNFTDGTSVVPYYAPNGRSPDYIDGYNMQHISTTSFTVSPGTARAFTNDTPIAYSGRLQGQTGILTVDITALGALGCYPYLPAVAAPTDDTTFPVYVLGDTSGSIDTTVIVATGDNFLLDGYDVYRRIGIIHCDGGANTMKFMFVSGNGMDRHYQYSDSIEIFSGAGGAGGLLDLSTGDLGLNPCFSPRIDVEASFTPLVAANILELNGFNNPVSSNWPVRFKGSTDAVEIVSNASLTPEDITGMLNQMAYKSTAGGDALELRLAGFSESLGLNAI